MGVKRRISEQRERHVLARAEAKLEDGERITHWARTRSAATRHPGVIYLTDRRCILYWATDKQEDATVVLAEITSWGLKEGKGGIVLGIESSDLSEFVRFPVDTGPRAAAAQVFLSAFAEVAPWPRTSLHADEAAEYEAKPVKRVKREKKSWAGMGKRIGVTILGTVLVLGGIVLSLPLVPGPGFLVLIAGLAVLSSEYDWAQDMLIWVRAKYKQAASKIKNRGKKASE